MTLAPYCVYLKLAVMLAAFSIGTLESRCIKLDTSIPNLEQSGDAVKMCPADCYTFNCDVNSTYVGWNYTANGTETFPYLPEGQARNTSYVCHEQFEVSFVHHAARSTANQVPLYRIRSSMIVYPYIRKDSFSTFYVQCHTKCSPKEERTIITKTYELAEVPGPPRNVRVVNTTDECSSSYITWDPPLNINKILFDHYEYTIDNDSTQVHQTIGRKTYSNFTHSSSEVLMVQLSVYAVDKCGRNGSRVERVYTLLPLRNKHHQGRDDL